ncbi:MAG TPA: carboxypeptidase-like regulatory domain-containing protein, partial [Terriglobales bacterium]|nr:carboxypeptidase-like regulatory domain-containing protein [Terriglobales bacterium]
MLLSYRKLVYSAISVFFYLSFAAAQSSTSSTINGTVVDSSGAVVPNAVVEIHNLVSQFERSTVTDSAGKFSFANVPFNPYHLSVQA